MDAPLEKILFIIANILAAYISVRPPRPTPDVNERARYREREETKDVLSSIASIVSRIFMVTATVWGMFEIYLILSIVYPSIQNPLLYRMMPRSPARRLTVADLSLAPTFVLSSALLYAGAFLRYLCYRTLGRHFTFELSLQKEHKLITEGPYSVVRHPSYLALTLAIPSMIVAQMFSRGTWWVESGMWGTWQGQVFGLYWITFATYVLVAMLGRMPKEDLMLRTEFKDEWVKWARKTPYAIIPYVW